MSISVMDGGHRMESKDELTAADLLLESRLTKVEVQTQNIDKELQDIKKSLRWLTGLVFSLNTTIIGILTKGFGAL